MSGQSVRTERPERSGPRAVETEDKKGREPEKPCTLNKIFKKLSQRG